MTVVSYSQLIFLLVLITYCINENDATRYSRQTIDNTNRNVGVPPQKPVGSMPMNNVPFVPSNNPNIVSSNEQNNQKLLSNNHQLLASSQPQMEPPRSGGFYNSPSYQPPPFTGEKPSGWFGTNYINWVSNRDSELDKNKLATEKNAPPINPQANIAQPRREDGGPYFLEKIAKQYASKGDKAFKFGQFETLQGRGAVCENHENFGGYVFGAFPCPMPASTGMNQLDQFCCGPANYQFCCNAQEFSQYQRGAFGGERYFGDQPFPKRSNYPSSTKKILAVMLPIASFIVITGIVALVFIYYKKFRKEQNRTRKPAGSIRLEDNYSIVPQDLSAERSISTEDEP